MVIFTSFDILETAKVTVKLEHFFQLGNFIRR